MTSRLRAIVPVVVVSVLALSVVLTWWFSPGRHEVADLVSIDTLDPRYMVVRDGTTGEGRKTSDGELMRELLEDLGDAVVVRDHSDGSIRSLSLGMTGLYSC